MDAAGLCVSGIVWQVIVERECLSYMSSTDSAGDVHFLMHHVVPESFTGFQQALILRCPCHIRHAGIEIYGAYGVPLHLILLTHRRFA